MVTHQVEKHLEFWQMHRPPVFRAVSDEDWYRIYDCLWQMITPDVIGCIEDSSTAWD